jgi:nicotinamidase-related amidase
MAKAQAAVLAEQGGPTESRPFFEYRSRALDFVLAPKTTALLIVDLQKSSACEDCGYIPIYRGVGHDEIADFYLRRLHETVIPSVQLLQRTFRQHGAPVVFLTVGTLTGDLTDMVPGHVRSARYWREIGLEPPFARMGTHQMEVLDEIAPAPNEAVIAKTTASGFTSSPLERVLWSYGVRQLVLCGVSTNYCVGSTLRDAADRGYDCVLAEDGCADLSTDAHSVALKSLEPFCRVETAASICTELGAPPG